MIKIINNKTGEVIYYVYCMELAMMMVENGQSCILMTADEIDAYIKTGKIS